MNEMVQEDVQLLEDHQVKLNAVADAWEGLPIVETWAKLTPGLSLLNEYTGLFEDIDAKMRDWIRTNEKFTDQQLEAMEELKKGARLQINAIKSIKYQNNSLAAEYIKLNEVLAKNGFLTKEQAKRYEELSEELKNQGGEVSNMIRLNTDNTQGMTKVVAGLTKYKTSTTDLTEAMVEQIELEAKHQTEGWRERVKNRQEEIAVLELISDKEFKFAMLRKQHDRIHVQAARDATTFQRKELGLMKQMGSIDIKRSEVLNDIAIAAQAGQDISSRVMQDYAQQLALLEAQKGALNDQLELTWQLKMAMANAFESSLSTNIADLIKGQESSFSDAILKIAQTTLHAAADVMAKEITSWVTKAVGLKSPEERMREAIELGMTNSMEVVKQTIETAEVPPVEITGYDLAGQELARKLTEAGGAVGDSIATKIRQALAGSSMDERFGGASPLPILGDKSHQGAVSAVVKDQNETSVIERLQGWVTTGDKARTGVIDAINEGTDAVIEGAKSTLDGLGGLGTSLGNSLGNMLGGLLTKGGGGGGFFSTLISSFIGGNSGGYATKKGFRSFGRGGVVPGRGNRDTVPAMLTPGEVVTNPARGQFAGQNNNVVVNVKVDSNGNTQTSTQNKQGEQMSEMGKLISGAVTEELLRQKRPGGILSPYGGGT